MANVQVTRNSCQSSSTRAITHDCSFRLLYFEELLGRAKLKEEEDLERKKRAKEKFSSMLRHLRKLDADTTWEQFVADYEREPEFRMVREAGAFLALMKRS